MDIRTMAEANSLSIQKQLGTELSIPPRISGGWNRGTLQAGYKEDADAWLRNWRTERGLPPDSGVLPNNRDEVPPYLRGWIFPKADASQQNNMMIAAGPRSPVKIYTDTDYYTGKEKKTVMPNFGAGRINFETLRFKDGFGPKDLVHHTEHFGEPRDEKSLIEQLMKDKTLNDSDYERILGPDYKNKIQQYQQNQSMLISGGPFLKTVGDGNVITADEYDDALEQIRNITNPLARKLAEKRLVNQYYLGLDPA